MQPSCCYAIGGNQDAEAANSTQHETKGHTGKHLSHETKKTSQQVSATLSNKTAFLTPWGSESTAPSHHGTPPPGGPLRNVSWPWQSSPAILNSSL